MTERPDPEKVYIALDAFITETDGREVVIAKGAHRMGDDPAVMRGSWIEADLDPETRARRRLDETPRAATRPRVEELWNKPEWIAIVKDYRATRKSRPAQLDVARQMGFDTEQRLRDRLRALDIPDWRAVHALIKGQPV